MTAMLQRNIPPGSSARWNGSANPPEVWRDKDGDDQPLDERLPREAIPGQEGRRADQGPVRNRRNPAAGSRPRHDVRLGGAQGSARAARTIDEDRSRPDVAARQPRRSGSRDGRRGQLQRRLGGAGRAGFRARRPQTSLSHRRVRCGGRRLGDRLQGQALAGRRPGRGPLQPGRRRRRGMQRRRPDVFGLAAHLGLRDAGRFVRAVLPRPGPPVDGAPEAPDVGGKRLLHAYARHRLSHAVRP